DDACGRIADAWETARRPRRRAGLQLPRVERQHRRCRIAKGANAIGRLACLLEKECDPLQRCRWLHLGVSSCRAPNPAPPVRWQPQEPCMPIFAVGSKTPRIHPTAFIAPTATIVGDVTVHEGASVWYGALLRGHTSYV